MLELDLSFGVGSGAGEPTRFHFANTSEGEAVAIDLVGIDTGLSGSIVASSVSITATPINGNVSFSAATGEFSYTPNSGISGSDAFRFTVENLAGDVSVSIKVTVAIARSALVIETVGSDDLSLGRDISPSSVDMEFTTTGAVDLDLGRSVNRVSTLGNADLRLGQGEAPVAQTVWTPERDAAGVVTAESLTKIPVTSLDELYFVEVAGFDPVAQIRAELDANGFDVNTKAFGTGGKVGATFRSWIGQAFDERTKIAYLLCSGGHGDSTLNGGWRINYSTMSADIFAMPSDPDHPDYPWNPDYKSLSGRIESGIGFGGVDIAASGGFEPYEYEQYYTEDGEFKMTLPDGRPPSSHTYQGVGIWDDNTVFSVRQAYAYHKLDTGETGREHMFYKGTSEYHSGGPCQYMIRCDQKNTYYGRMARVMDSFGMYKLEGANPTQMIKLGTVPAGLYATDYTRLAKVNDQKMIFWCDHRGTFAEFDMISETWGPVQTVNNALTTINTDGDLVRVQGASNPSMFIEEWGANGVVLTTYAGMHDTIVEEDGLPVGNSFFYLDLSDNTLKRVEPKGAYPDQHGSYTENKSFATELHGMKFIIYLWSRSGETSKVYLARVT
ncbi:Ig-like domain-containing protein [Neptunomonas sp. XY-337]|uniref:Ig-like domain-containing protein n=1 Tax=Neptunomonas sp. XY-337 TaxID=2561897 RepID=UPI0010AA1820|nr:Ig-like domain-containing protein [Neptunomonas sp. XY-337]